ncbi:hypothetical protein STEG23_023632 [Scotinomys teguina]
MEHFRNKEDDQEKEAQDDETIGGHFYGPVPEDSCSGTVQPGEHSDLLCLCFFSLCSLIGPKQSIPTFSRKQDQNINLKI